MFICLHSYTHTRDHAFSYIHIFTHIHIHIPTNNNQIQQWHKIITPFRSQTPRRACWACSLRRSRAKRPPAAPVPCPQTCQVPSEIRSPRFPRSVLLHTHIYMYICMYICIHTPAHIYIYIVNAFVRICACTYCVYVQRVVRPGTALSDSWWGQSVQNTWVFACAHVLDYVHCTFGASLTRACILYINKHVHTCIQTHTNISFIDACALESTALSRKSMYISMYMYIHLSFYKHACVPGSMRLFPAMCCCTQQADCQWTQPAPAKLCVDM